MTYTICLYNHRALHLKRERCSKCRKSKLCAGNSSNKFNWIYEFLSCSIQVWNSSSFSISFRSRLFFSCWKVYFSFQVAPFDNVDVVPNGEEFTLANTYLKAHFSDQGLLQVNCIWRYEILYVYPCAGHNHNGGQCEDGRQNWVYSIWNSKPGGQKWGLPILAWYHSSNNQQSTLNTQIQIYTYWQKWYPSISIHSHKSTNQDLTLKSKHT